MYQFRVNVFPFLRLLQRVMLQLLDSHLHLIFPDPHQSVLVINLILDLSRRVQLSLKFYNLFVFELQEQI